MADHEKIAKELELKRKMLAKNVETLKAAELELKKLQGELEKAEKSVKTEKDQKKLKKLQETASGLKTEVENQTKTRDILKDAQSKLNTSIAGLFKEAVAAFGESRQGFLDWFKEASKTAVGMIDRAKKMHDAVVEEKEQVGKLLEKGETMKAAEAAGAAGKFAQATADVGKQFEKLVEQEWTSLLTVQRNLAPLQFGLENDDVQVHKGLTTKVYWVFKERDQFLHEMKAVVESANTEAEEAESILEAGGTNLKAYEKMVAKTAQTVAEAVKKYQGMFETSWPRMILDGGQRLVEETDKFNKGEQDKEVTLKKYEQGMSAIPKAWETLEGIVTHAAGLVKREQTRLPEQFIRTLKPKIDQMQLIVVALSRKQEQLKPKYELTLQNLAKLGKAVGQG